MKRRGFLKGASAAAMVVAGGSSLMSMAGCGGSGGSGGSSSPVVKLPFLAKESLESIRAKIAANGYSFTVDNNYVYDQTGIPGAPAAVVQVDPTLSTAAFPNTDALLVSSSALPSAFDLRNYKGHSYIGPVRDQGHSALCWDLSSCDVAGGSHNYRNGLFDDNCVVLSPMYVHWTYGIQQSNNLEALYSLTSFGLPYYAPTGLEGACREIDFPYIDYSDSLSPSVFLIAQSKLAPRITLRRCARVFPANYQDTTAQIKAALFKYGAVTVAIAVSAALQAYQSGVYEDTYTEPSVLPDYYRSTNPSGGADHAVSLVGWDDYPPEGGGGCWILRNTWGISWGENGYMRVRYNSAQVNCAAAFVEASLPSDGQRTIQGKIEVNNILADTTTLYLTGADNFAMVVDAGLYAFHTLSPGTYTVTPAQPGATFVPASTTVVVTNQDFSGVDFAGATLTS
jgi:hypothetical protein